MSTDSSGYPCPYCHNAKLEAVATAPYVRGFLVAYQIGSKTFIGCTSCVRKKIFGEAGLSMILGWFSLTALVLNPFMIVYNLIRGAFVGPNAQAVSKKLKELGLPDSPRIVDISSIGYALAASMIMADGDVDEAELQAAERAGDEVFGEFDEAALRMIVQSKSRLPPVEDLAAMLKDSLDEPMKQKVMSFLWQIAAANGHISSEEQQVLQRVALGLGTQIKG